MKCTNCNSNFNYTFLLSSQFKSKIECSKCGYSFDITLLSRIIFSILLVLPLPFFNTLFTSIIQGVVCYTIYLLVLILLNPFIIRIKDNSNTLSS